MDDLDLVIRGYELSTSESIYTLEKGYYESMFKENALNLDRDDILQKRLENCPLRNGGKNNEIN